MATVTRVNSAMEAAMIQRRIEGRIIEAVHQGFVRAGLYQQRVITRTVPVDRGELKASVNFINHGMRGATAGGNSGSTTARAAAMLAGGSGSAGMAHSRGVDVHVDAPHAGPMEFGTRPYWPPLAPLMEWAQRQGAGNGYALGKYVQQKIARQGLAPRYFVKKSIPGTLRILNRGFVSSLRAIVASESRRGRA